MLRKHGQLIGQYRRRYGKDSILNKRPTYEHYTGKFFLYYNNRSQGFWAVGERLGSEVVRIENQGDRVCPYYLKSMWRYADGDLNALVYDVTLRIACMDGNTTYLFIRSNVRRQNVIEFYLPLQL